MVDRNSYFSAIVINKTMSKEGFVEPSEIPAGQTHGQGLMGLSSPVERQISITELRILK